MHKGRYTGKEEERNIRKRRDIDIMRSRDNVRWMSQTTKNEN